MLLNVICGFFSLTKVEVQSIHAASAFADRRERGTQMRADRALN